VLEPATFKVSRGETLGLAGLLGSGRTETMKLIFGAIAGDCGSITVSATGTRETRPRSPRDAMRLGIGFCPEDRKDEAVFPGMSVAENMLVVIQAKRGWLRPLPKKKAAAIVDEHVAKLQIRTPDAQRPIENLSGGNQQKVVLSRWLAAQPSLLLPATKVPPARPATPPPSTASWPSPPSMPPSVSTGTPRKAPSSTSPPPASKSSAPLPATNSLSAREPPSRQLTFPEPSPCCDRAAPHQTLPPSSPLYSPRLATSVLAAATPSSETASSTPAPLSEPSIRKPRLATKKSFSSL
jgi:ABC-type ATPase involved in cell division